MEDLKDMMSRCIRAAGQASSAGEYKKAAGLIVQACECAGKLAQRSFGRERADYQKKFSDLKDMAKKLLAKDAEKQAQTPPAPPQQDTPPRAEAPKPAQNTPPAPPAPPKEDESGEDGESGNGEGSGSGEGGNAPAHPPRKERSDSIAPQTLADYVGQKDAVTAVSELIHAALLKNSALMHIILYGSHGLGKTTFAKIIANEMHANFVEINATKITTTEMVAIFKKLKPKDIVFIDEIHTVPLPVAESVLYSAMQDGRITYTEGKGKFARTQVLVLPPFTLIGATTEIGKLAKPFTQRAIQIHLVEYTDEIIGSIITRAFNRLGLTITDENGLYIARRCRNNPRIANNTVRRIADKAIVRFATVNDIRSEGSLDSVETIRKLGIEVTRDVIDRFFDENGIDEYGLERGDRDLLRIIIERFNGGPVGLDTLSFSMNEATNVISQKYEAYLIKKGMLRIDRDGRVAMPAAYRALGLPVPADAEDDDKPDRNAGKNTGNNANNNANNNAGNGGEPPRIDVLRNHNPADDVPPETPPDDKPTSKYEKRVVVASHVPDVQKCAKIEDLITYPPNAGPVDTPLDVLFPDIVKEYDAEPQHMCELEIDFGDFKREIVCDSFLESRFATSLASVGYVQDFKAQTIELAYVSQELVNKRYFPDFAIKDYKGRIAIIEMKNFEMSSYHLNIDKYEELKRYCESKGYGYAEIMRAYDTNSYISLEALKAAPVNKELEQYIIDTIEKNGEATGEGCFTMEDFENYVAEHGAADRTEIYTILLNNRNLRNVDRVGKDFRIILN